MTPPSFAEILARGAALLRELPRGRDDLPRARARVEQLQSQHPGLHAELLVDRAAGSPRTDYDLLLQDPEGGTLVLSWWPDDGIPWVIEFAEYRAAREVVRVNASQVTIQEALLFLKLAGQDYPDLLEQIVTETLIRAALEADPPEVSEAEAQAAADRFRSASGLRSAAATNRWLEEMGLSEARFAELAYGMARRRKLIDRATADRIEPYFAAHRPEFDLLYFCRFELPDEPGATALAAQARSAGLLAAAQSAVAGGARLGGGVRSVRAGELPPELAAADSGEVIGPVASAGRWSVAEVFDRQPAVLDGAVRLAARERCFQEWLAEQREQAEVRWLRYQTRRSLTAPKFPDDVFSIDD